MKCRDCKFLSEPQNIGESYFPSVRCTLGIWDKENKEGVPQWYSYGQAVLNRGPVKRLGEACTRGEPKRQLSPEDQILKEREDRDEESERAADYFREHGSNY